MLSLGLHTITCLPELLESQLRFTMSNRTSMNLVRSLSLVALLAGILFHSPLSAQDSDLPPALPREFRAAWVATVANIDWPSKPGLSSQQQQAEMITILDRCKSLNLNAVVLQVRTSADAFYSSDLEPWSEYLTGEQGKAPVPLYDPLELWVRESHARGLELHAWFNPYRARHTAAKSPNAISHIATRLPHAVKSYGGYQWMDPAESDASEHTLKVILDVVRRYDIDGVHIDDYFYPYPVSETSNGLGDANSDTKSKAPAEVPFPDDPAWEVYQSSKIDLGKKLSRDDWRRRNVDQLIERIYSGIKGEKKHVKFGISPFGIGRPSKRPQGIVGFSQYDKLYADAELWLEKGWLDYFTPQLYWPIDKPPQAFGVLLDYWAKENKLGRHIWPGLYTSRINDTETSWLPTEIINQILLIRNYAANDKRVLGHVHFSMKCLLENRKMLNDSMKGGIYQSPAAIPASTWLDNVPPPKPILSLGTNDPKGDGSKTNIIKIRVQEGSDVTGFAIWKLERGDWKLAIVPALKSASGQAEADFSSAFLAGEKGTVVCSALDRCGNEGERARLEF